MAALISYKILSYVIVLVAVFLPLSSCDLVDNTCKKTPNFQLCSSILRGDPKSSGADVARLALIAVNSLKSKATSALQTINQLLSSRPELRSPLTECNKNYNFIINSDVPEAIEAITKGNPKFGEESMNDAAIVARECENGFRPSTSPITQLNENAIDTSRVASAIIKQLE